MADWVKRILDNRKQKNQKRERDRQIENESKDNQENNRKQAIAFISNVVVPAFKKAETKLESDELKMKAWYDYEPQEEKTFIDMEVNTREEKNEKNQIFHYRIDMEYTSCSVTPYAICSIGNGQKPNKHKIEKNNNDSSIPKTTGELINITVDDIYSDLMKCFFEFDKIN